MKKPAPNTGVGASSIMLIIVVVCLTLFAVLSYVTARNDAVLSERMLASVQCYYSVDALAQRNLMAVDEWIAGGMQGQPDGVELTENEDGSLAFSVSVDDIHTLKVTLRVTDDGYTVERYIYENNAEWSVDATEYLYS